MQNKRAITIETLADLKRHGMPVLGTCPACQRGEYIDLDAVAALKGWDWSSVRQRWPVKCRECGSKQVVVTICLGNGPGVARKYG